MKKSFLNVKPFQETLHADMCGPASLKIILGFYGVERTEREVANMAIIIKGIGWNDKDIARIAESLGFKTEIKNESCFDDIGKWLDRGVPIIVDWFSKGRKDYDDSEMADGHYSVVAGLDDEYIYLQDPEIGSERKIRREDFMRVWFDFKGDRLKPEELIIRQLIAIYK